MSCCYGNMYPFGDFTSYRRTPIPGASHAVDAFLALCVIDKLP